MQLNYSRELVAPSRRAGEPYERGQPEIDPAGKRVFVGSSDHGLYALRAENGSQIWRFETLGFVQCAPLYDPVEGVVYFGSNDGALYKVSAQDGALLWRFMSNAEVSRRPVLHGGLLYVVNANDTLMAIEPTSGKLRWSQHRSPAAGMEVAGYAGPAVFRGKVYTGFSDGNVMAYDAETGAERWQPVDLAAEAEQTLGEVPQQLDVDTTPVPNVLSTGPVVYVASYAGGVFALDAETGVQVWPNTAVSGVSDLTLWREPAHTRRDGGPPEPSAFDLWIASSGTSGPVGPRSRNRSRALAPRRTQRRRIRARTNQRRANDVRVALGHLPSVTTGRRTDRRHPRRRRRQHDTVRLRLPRVRNDQRRHVPKPDRHTADLSGRSP